VPLTAHQERLARLLSANRTFDSYLAGGAAVLIEPNTKRYSADLAYFHDSERRVAEAFASDTMLLEQHGYQVALDLSQPGYVRAIVRQGSEATKVEWARDSSWRFMPTVRDARVGFVLHPVDLAVNKVLALAGRDESRIHHTDDRPGQVQLHVAATKKATETLGFEAKVGLDEGLALAAEWIGRNLERYKVGLYTV
jgi:hypothetical protein